MRSLRLPRFRNVWYSYGCPFGNRGSPNILQKTGRVTSCVMREHRMSDRIVAAVLMALACAADVGAQVAGGAGAYPARPIRLIIPFPPGGSTDIYARILAPEMARALGQQVVIDNRPGAGGSLGAELASKAPPDGYTIWIGQANNLAIGPAMRAKNAYDPVRDFTPIALIMK